MRGRPRKFCTACVPPGTGAAAARAWRAANPHRVEEANAARRAGLSELVCVECGRTFTARRSHRLTCGEQCRNSRKGRRVWERVREGRGDPQSSEPVHNVVNGTNTYNGPSRW